MKLSLKRNKIVANWKEHSSSRVWYIIDWDGHYFKEHPAFKPDKDGGCCVYTPSKVQDQSHDITDIIGLSVCMRSESEMELISTGLKRCAWNPLQGVGQCDAILFPSSDAEGDALLLVETKYTDKDGAWEKYKDSALKQITDTISQLAKRECPIYKRTLFGLISCPLLNEVGASVFSPSRLMEIFQNYRLQLHMGNTATFKDSQSISFSA